MGWLSILLLVIQYGPAIFNLVTEIVELIRRLRQPSEKVLYRAELQDAVKHYRATGDRRLLRRLRDRLQSKCFDEECPTK